MIRVKMVQHINVQITNRERTRAWYEQVLGATFLERGAALNTRMLQLNIGNAELHFSDTDEPILAPQPHFALEVEDWDATLAHLDRLEVPHSRTGGGAFTRSGTGDEGRWGRREDNGEYYTYLHDPDSNLIELVHHPLGLVDAAGKQVEIPSPHGMRWRQLPEIEARREKSAATTE